MRLFALMTCVLLSCSTFAATITVNQDQSIPAALSKAQVGDMVIVNAGTYVGDISGKTGVRVQANGVVDIYGGATLICNNCSIVGFRFDHGSVWMKGNDILLEGNQFKGKGGSEDYGNLFGERITVRRNLFYGVRIPEDLASIGGGNYEHNDVLQFWDNNGEVLRNVLIEENIFTDYVQGVFLALETGTVSRVSNWTVRNNVFWGTDFVSTGNLIGNPSHGMFAGKYAVPGVSITNNLFYNNANQISIYGSGASAIVQGNIIINGGTAYATGDGSQGSAFVRGTKGNILFENGWNGWTTENYGQGPDKYVSPMLANVNSLLGADGAPFTSDDGWPSTNPAVAGYGPQIDTGTTSPPSNTAPILALTGPTSPIQLQSGQTQATFLLTANAVDPGDTVTYRWGNGATSNAISVVQQPGIVAYTCTATDSGGLTDTKSIVMTVAAYTPPPLADTTAPVITLVGGNVSLTVGQPYAEPGYSATDNVDTSVFVTVSGVVNQEVVGTYTLTYTAKDTAGNVAVPKTRTVTVAAPPLTFEQRLQAVEKWIAKWPNRRSVRGAGTTGNKWVPAEN